MNYRLGRLEDLDAICQMVDSAKDLMSSQGIEQWDEIYPAKEDFKGDIEKGTLYVALEGSGENKDENFGTHEDVASKKSSDRIVAIYVISTECDDEYLKCTWEYENPCILHRLCVSPDYQNKGVGKILLKKIENQLVEMGYESCRLDAFSENPFALKLYEKNGYERRGHADWRKGRFYLMEKKIG